MRTLRATTPNGREVSFSAESVACSLQIVADIPSLGIRSMPVRESKLNGQDVLVGHAAVQGKYRPVGIAITPDIAAWLHDFEAEEKALREARMEVFYLRGWEGHTITVDSRLSDDEIIASMGPGFWREENAPESFREHLQKARAERAAKAEARQREDDRFEALKAEAARTGKDVLLRQYADECDGSAGECSTDIVYEYIQPDGSLKIERVHTF